MWFDNQYDPYIHEVPNQRHCSTNFQAPFRRVEVPFFGATTSAVQALLLGVVQAPFKAHLSHHLSAVQAPLETPFFWAASRRCRC